MAYSYDINAYQPARHDVYSRSDLRDPNGYMRYSNCNKNDYHAHDQIPMTSSRPRDSRHDYNYDLCYDPRSSYREQHLPPPRPWESTYTVTDRRRAPSVNRRTWPPRPTVEDEAVSLAKEYPRPRLHDNSDEVCMRGTVDQEPILIELDNGERRFVLIPSQEDKSSRQSKAGRTDKKSTRESKQKDGPPALKLDVDETNLFARRQPSPYAFTKTPKTPTNRHSAEYFLSPDALTPPSSTSKVPFQKDLIDPMKKQNRSSGRDTTSRPEVSDDSDLDATHVAKLRSRRIQSRVSFNEGVNAIPNRHSSDLSDNEAHRSTRTQSFYDTGTKKSTTIPRSVPANSVGVDNDLSRASSRAEPKTISKSHRSESVYTSRPSKNEFAGPGSSLRDAVLHTPPDSPKLAPHGDFSRRSVSKPVSGTNSRPNSRPNSQTASPLTSSVDLNQASYILSQSPNSQADRSSTYPPSTQERASKPSKFSSSMTQDSMEASQPPPRIDIKSPSPVRPITKPPLPYPDDDGPVLMPSHESFQVCPDGLSAPFQARTLPRPSSTTSTTRSGTTEQYRNSASMASSDIAPRPSLPARHTLHEVFPRSRGEATRTVSTDSISRNIPSTALPAMPPNLPPCPRTKYSRKYDDWYTLEGESLFDVCPSCIDGIVRPSIFGNYFKRAASRPSSVRTRCDFGSPWTRLAWLLTLKRQRQDLDLLYALAAITNIEPECPGDHESNGSWFGLRDQSGEFIPTFAICSCDLNYLEALFPSLLGAFTRLPQANNVRSSRVCSMHTKSRRFAQYLDLIVTIDDKARATSRTAIADLTPLYDLLRSNAYRMECPRDRISLDQTWHYMPSLPDLTICEECYDEAVWPCIKSGSELASRFNRVLKPVPPTATRKFEGGASCQLYSPRMRKIWERAMRYGDDEGLRYLRGKVRERKDVEEDLRLQQVEMKRLLDRGSEVDKEWLRRELERIEKEWAEWE